MVKKHRWLTSLALGTASLLVGVASSQANETYSKANLDYFQGREFIPIEVEPPVYNNEAPQPNNFRSPANPGTCSATLQPAIQRIIGDKALNNWGILVEAVGDRRFIYGLNENKYFIPASNNKIFTTAAALQRFSPSSTIRSKSLQDWVNVTNKRSDNAYAEALMKHVGGPGAVKAAISQLGVNPQGFRVADGSGLSRSNAATPRSLVETLQAMYYAPNKDVFIASLPVAGQNGTLRRRMKATPAEGNVYAKTGTLKGVRALSGYINNPSHGPLAFSILANDWSRSGNALVRAIDQVVVQLNTLGPCP